MIEIVFDRNPEDVFFDEKRPVCLLDDLKLETWEAYRVQARQILEKYKDDKIIIVRFQGTGLSINWLAVALFIESCFFVTNLEAVVFKPENYEEAVSAYKPFVALTVGLKYVLRIYQENWKAIYKDIAGLSYLGLSIKEDYLRNKLVIRLQRENMPQKMSSSTLDEALEIIGIMKTLALLPLQISVDAEIAIVKNDDNPDIDRIIKKVIDYIKPLID